MKKERLIFISTLFLLLGIWFYTIYRYEMIIDQKQYTIEGGVKIKTYTAKEVIELIKKQPYYQGDSLTIFEDGRFVSQVGYINGGISDVYNNQPSTIEALKQASIAESLPLPLVVYRHVIPYVIPQHGDKSKKK